MSIFIGFKWASNLGTDRRKEKGKKILERLAREKGKDVNKLKQ